MLQVTEQREHGLAPSIIGLRPKSILSIHEDKAIEQACEANVGIDRLVPVILGMEQLGWTLGKRGSRKVMFYSDRKSIDKFVMAGITGFDSILVAQGAGQWLQQFWSKGHTSTPVVSNWYDLWPVAGNPLSGTYTGTASASRQFTDADVGAIPHGGNVSTFLKYLTYMMGISSAGTVGPTLVLYDRCVAYQTVPYNNNAANTFTQSNTPVSLRYNSGPPGMLIVITGQVVASSTAQYVSSLVYTNQSGSSSTLTGSNTSTNIIPSFATPTATLGARVVSPSLATTNTLTAGYSFPLAPGDTGAESITSFTTSAATINTGKLCLTLMRPLATLPLGIAGAPAEKDLVVQTAAIAQIFDGACISALAYFAIGTASTFSGQINDVWL